MVHKIEKGKLSNYFLADMEGGEYSAYPGDYFMLQDDQKLEGLYLGATQTIKGGFKRKIILKKNPTLKDLKEIDLEKPLFRKRLNKC
jgi:hypothetical protein